MSRHGVKVATDQHPAGPAELGSSNDRVSEPIHLEVRTGTECSLHQISKSTLMVGLAGYVDQLRSEFDNTGVNAQRRQTGHVATVVR